MSRCGMQKRRRILIVEDDLQARLGLQQLMGSIGYDAVGVGHWLDALRLMKEALFDLAVVDMILSVKEECLLTGLDLIPLLRAFNPKVPVVLMTGQSDDQLHTLALKRGATFYLEKPVEPGLITGIVRRLLADTTDQETALPASRPSKPVR